MSSDYDRCPKCREFGRTKTHRCPPKWFVFWLDGDGFHQEPMPTNGYSSKEAVEKYIRQLDCDTGGDYGFSSGETTPALLVISEAEYLAILESYEDKEAYEIPWAEVDGERYRVEGEYMPQYYAHRLARHKPAAPAINP